MDEDVIWEVGSNERRIDVNIDVKIDDVDPKQMRPGYIEFQLGPPWVVDVIVTVNGILRVV